MHFLDAGNDKAIRIKAAGKTTKKCLFVPTRIPPNIPKTRVDLTLFGGSSGNRRFYKNEKETVPEFNGTVLEDQWHTAGDNIMLRLQYRGYPEPIVTWFKGQEPVAETMRSVVTADGTLTELAIFDAQRNDGGYYSCRIENEFGVRETGCHVFIEERPDSTPKGIYRSPFAAGNHRLYRSVLYTPAERHSKF